MSFDTPAYAAFLVLSVLLHRICPHRFRPAMLLCASLFFYACWSVKLTGAILGVVLFTYVCALGISHVRKRAVKKLILAASVCGCLGLLGWFKYFNFLLSAISSISGRSFDPIEILLPVGCSFYTFQALSYVIDVYRGKIDAELRPDLYALYVCFFPQLVAGPIERADSLLPQLRDQKDASRDDIILALKLLLAGFFRKIVIADLLSPIVDRVYSAATPDGSAVFIGTLLFAFQIYCDFAGYSDIARGSALLMGIRLRQNFDRPYLARSLKEFWRRWHMSLTAWFTDYVYVPMGGSRNGKWRQFLAIIVVFLLSGLWHGAEWSFVLWGLWHALLYSAETFLLRGNKSSGSRPPICVLPTFLAVLLSWILFRSANMVQAFNMFHALFSLWNVRAGLSLCGIGTMDAACIAAALLQLPLLHRISHGGRAQDMTYFYLAVSILAAFLLRSAANSGGSFIYFRF